MATDTSLTSYYTDVAPFDVLCELLTRNNAYQLQHREISFEIERRTAVATLAKTDSFYKRKLVFADAADWRKQVLQQQSSAAVLKFDRGAVYDKPLHKESSKRNMPTTIGAELVFDIDISDYDDVRVCCKGKNACDNCWLLVKSAAQLLEVRLRSEFGFKHTVWVFSGRRGVHCWVLDDKAFSLPNEHREAIVDYFNADRDAAIAGLPLSTFWRGEYTIMLGVFNRHLTAQNLYRNSAELTKALISIGLSETVAELCAKKCADADNAEVALNAIVSEYNRANVIKRPNLKTEIVAAFLLPRLDRNVTTKMEHLVKLPFSPHPSTGFLCLPVSLEHLTQGSLKSLKIAAASKELSRNLLRPHIDILLSAFPWRRHATMEE